MRPGDPATPADEADVALVVALSDVREAPTLADYTGELELRRTADHRQLNGRRAPRPGRCTDQALRATVPCAVTAEAQVGSTCG